MVSMLTYTGNADEIPVIRELAKNLAAHLSEDKWELSYFSSLKELQCFVERQPLIDMACYDVTVKGSLSCLGQIRNKYRDMLLMLIADNTLSPMEYVRPDILASGLILRPFTKEALQEKLKDMMMEHLIKAENPDTEAAFVLSGREGKTRIPYRQIYYFESRSKKLYLRLLDREMAFYGTMEELEEKLPDVFLRCHRSFLVNRSHIERILLSQSEIVLSHGISVPLSRSYKPYFREFR